MTAAKRLYIGGLSHTISEKDLKDRFGKFGDVQDVELRTRKDVDGVPYKTFGYINIDISDADYKRCMTVLNKSQWKGGLLQIELAKESFLHKLAEERQQATEKPSSKPEDQREKLVESLKNVGVEKFHMKAAVPGTEVPGHKDWVVSKFGRVLPVLNLKCQGKNKVMKYDPSKHSHNIKKLDSSVDAPSLTPLSQLSWEILEANDEISKKRRGEFPPQKARPAKIRKDSSNKPTANSQVSHVPIDVESSEKTNGTSDTGQKYEKTNRMTKLTQAPASKKPQYPSVCVFGGDGDSDDEEIRMLVARQRRQEGRQEPAAEGGDDVEMEVVGDNYLSIKTKSDCHLLVGPSENDDKEYDSADTDEILTSSKGPPDSKQLKLEACRQSSPPPINDFETSNAEVKSASKKKVCEKIPSESKTQLSESVCADEEEENVSEADNVKVKKVSKKKACEKLPPESKPQLSESVCADEEEENVSETNNVKVKKASKKKTCKKVPSESKSQLSESVCADEEEQNVSETDNVEVKKASKKKACKKVPPESKPQLSESVCADEKEENVSATDIVKVKKASKKKACEKVLSESSKPVSIEDNKENDSADTDEILTSIKTKKGFPDSEQQKLEACTQSSQTPVNDSEMTNATVKKASKKKVSMEVPSESKSHLSESICADEKDKNDLETDNTEGKKASKKKVCKKAPSESKSHLSESVSEDEDDEKDEYGDSDYEAMFSNCHRLEISLADLEQLAKESSNSSSDDGSDSQAGPSEVAEQQTTPPESRLPKKGTTPEEILAAILGEDSDDEKTGKKKKKKKKNTSVPLPAFQGTAGLIGMLKSAVEDCGLKRQLDEDSLTEAASLKKKLKTVVENEHIASEADAQTVISLVLKTDSTSTNSSSSSETLGTNGEGNVNEVAVHEVSDRVKTKQPTKTEKSLPKSDTSTSDGSLSSEESESSDEEEGSSKVAEPGLAKRPKSVGDPQKQLQDNARRLAAMEQRQTKAEQQKKLIQGALALDTPTVPKKNHIVFGSDDDESDDGQGAEGPAPENSREKDSKKPDSSKLFDSSDEDDEDDGNDKDEERFQIKPQFEGRSGQKLMQLQSRFGADERFNMDSRFLDSDEEADVSAKKPAEDEVVDELEEEKKKNLDILQNLLNINIQTSDGSKPSAKVKTFRDISALQYDPTREEHATFETKLEETKKESKAERRKKREEAEKLPEVSKEIYYDVTADLKAVFGPTKQLVDVEEKTTTEEEAWDKEEEKMEVEEEEQQQKSQQSDAETTVLSAFLPATNGDAKEEESSGFKFSFFGDNAEMENPSVLDEYKVETLKGPRASWQADPRFQDSSSEEEDETEEEAKDQISAAKYTEEPVPTKKKFFFFHQDHDRLEEGPRMFYRSAKLEDQRENWEEKRTALIEEYRKKHKDARRKIRASQKMLSA